MGGWGRVNRHGIEDDGDQTMSKHVQGSNEGGRPPAKRHPDDKKGRGNDDSDSWDMGGGDGMDSLADALSKMDLKTCNYVGWLPAARPTPTHKWDFRRCEGRVHSKKHPGCDRCGGRGSDGPL